MADPSLVPSIQSPPGPNASNLSTNSDPQNMLVAPVRNGSEIQSSSSNQAAPSNNDSHRNPPTTRSVADATRSAADVPQVQDNKNVKAPMIAGIGKIGVPPEHLEAKTNNSTHDNTQPLRIVIPQRSINGGFDFKLESNPHRIKLHGIMTPQEYKRAIDAVNDTIKPSRSNRVDTALLISSPFLVFVPLAVWGVRHGGQTRKRHYLLDKALQEFHVSFPHLFMQWNRDTPHGEKYLTIVRAPLLPGQTGQSSTMHLVV